MSSVTDPNFFWTPELYDIFQDVLILETSIASPYLRPIALKDCPLQTIRSYYPSYPKYRPKRSYFRMFVRQCSVRGVFSDRYRKVFFFTTDVAKALSMKDWTSFSFRITTNLLQNVLSTETNPAIQMSGLIEYEELIQLLEQDHSESALLKFLKSCNVIEKISAPNEIYLYVCDEGQSFETWLKEKLI